MSNHNRLAECASHAVETIIDNYEEWNAEAMQAAQVEQSDDAWRDVLRDHLKAVLFRAFEIRKFCNECGGSGRVRVAVADWEGDCSKCRPTS